MVTLTEVRRQATPELYPRDALEGCHSALVLFAAAWHGKQDAIWIAEAGIKATCVDLDHERLWEMCEAYSEDWQFVNADVFDYTARATRRWDVVSLDCPTNLFEKCADLLPRWCSLARRTVILGCGPRVKLNLPEAQGWKLTNLLHRSNFGGGVYWAVVERKLDDPLAEGWRP